MVPTISLRPPRLLVLLVSLAYLIPATPVAARAPLQPSSDQAPSTLDLPEDRAARVRLPDIALPLADPATPGKVSLADLRGEKYILHVFASW